MQEVFKTDITSIDAQVASIDPVAYGQTRNHLDGAVTYLSPYISRGVISTKQVLASVLNRGYKMYQIESFVKELCWRDYFQRVGQEKNLSLPIKQAQENVAHRQMPLAVLQAQTGIEGIDQAISKLYQTGYMHNHARMYTASLVCNIAQSDWLMPARWMYYHLLDGDWASNACSWQWVAAANSGKKYYANQENINKYTKTTQRGSYLDCSYEALAIMDIPAQLKTIAAFEPEATNHILPKFTGFKQLEQTNQNSFQLTGHKQSKETNQNPFQLTGHKESKETNQNSAQLATYIQSLSNQPVFIYNYYNLDPRWHKDETGLRILLLEPNFFEQYPISSKCWNFMLQLAAEIPHLQIYYGSFSSLLQELHQIQDPVIINSIPSAASSITLSSAPASSIIPTPASASSITTSSAPASSITTSSASASSITPSPAPASSIIPSSAPARSITTSSASASSITPSPAPAAQYRLGKTVFYKEHPLNIGYQGVEEPRDWIAPTVQGYYPSFFAYWKAVKKVLDK